MTTGNRILADIEALGATVSVADGKIVTKWAPLTEELRNRIRSHKPELAVAIQQRDRQQRLDCAKHAEELARRIEACDPEAAMYWRRVATRDRLIAEGADPAPLISEVTL